MNHNHIADTHALLNSTEASHTPTRRLALQTALGLGYAAAAMPLMAQLGMPVLFCHKLEADADGMLVNYHLRMPDQKRAAVKAFKGLNFKVVAAGDSYNDTAMLGEAHAGILFHPPENVIREFPQFPVTMNYSELNDAIRSASARI